MKNSPVILSEQELLIILNKTVGLFIEHNITTTGTIAEYLQVLSKQIDPEPTPSGPGAPVYNPIP